MANRRRGFTLIELLTVIAIIALLAAILFPVFQRVNENRRVATCMSNMHSLYVAASQYRDDNGVFPPALFGFAERPDNLPWVSGDPGPVPMNSVKKGFLYPAYVKDPETFRCPDSPDRDKSKVTIASYPPSSPWKAYLTGATGKDYPSFGIGPYAGYPASYDGKAVSFYNCDSYDISTTLDTNGKRLPGADGQAGYWIVYSTDWTAAKAQGLDTRKDLPNQLKYVKSFPADRTVIAWCNYHVLSAGADKCPVIFASGTAKTLDWRQLLSDGFNVANK